MPLSSLMYRYGRRALPGPPSVLAGLRIRDDGSPGPAVLPLAVTTLLIASAAPTAASVLTIIACVFILIIGMPHGMFDYLTLRQISRGSRVRLVATTAAYLGVAGGIWLLWQYAPFAALCAFISVAMLHFSEDWIGQKSRLGAAAMAISIIALPAMLYSAELSALFVLIGGPGAGVVADYLRLVAPVFGLVAIANILIDFGGESKSEARNQAGRNSALLCAALLLPPGIGFAVYFCLYHSPIHFVEGRKTLMSRQDNPNSFFLFMSLASAAAVVFVLVMQPFQAMDANLIAATFQTLSILTVPHMLLPLFAAPFLRSANAPTARSGDR